MRVKLRHKILRFLLGLGTKPAAYIKYGYTTKEIDEDALGIKPPYLVLAPHYAQLDPFLLELAFPRHLFFVANDSIFDNPFGKIIKSLLSPIPIAKGTVDARTVMDIITATKNGACVALFPEGNTTFTGVTCNIPASIGKLIKKLNVPVVFFLFEGLYFAAARWSGSTQRGPCRGYVSKVLFPHEYENLSGEEIYEIVKSNLYYNCYDIQRKLMIKYKGKNKANYLERVLYRCPVCRSYGTMHSKGDEYICSCGYKVRVNDFGFFEGDNIIYDNVHDWYNWQKSTLDAEDFDYEKCLITQDCMWTKTKKRRGKARKVAKKGVLALDSSGLRYWSKKGKIFDYPMSELKDIAPNKKNNILVYTRDNKSLNVKLTLDGRTLMLIDFFHKIKNKWEENDGTAK